MDTIEAGSPTRQIKMRIDIKLLHRPAALRSGPHQSTALVITSLPIQIAPGAKP